MALPLKDGGYKSRKWTSYVLTSVLILLAGFLMGADKLVQVVFGLVSAYAIYNGANVGRDFVASRGNPAGTTTSATTSTVTTTPAPGGNGPAPATTQQEEGS